MQQADCVRSIWIVGAIAGLVVMLFASVLGHTPWPGGLFLGIMACLLGGGLLSWLVVSGRQAVFDPRLPQPRVQPVEARAAITCEAMQDLTGVRGIGPKTQDALYQIGVTRLQQIADWDDAEVDLMSARLGRLGARIAAEDWSGQARVLLDGQVVTHG